jgi:hypothetical protein
MFAIGHPTRLVVVGHCIRYNIMRMTSPSSRISFDRGCREKSGGSRRARLQTARILDSVASFIPGFPCCFLFP